MATISVSGHSGRRAVDHHLPLVPFIDFMVCLVAFLMVTAVWSQASRLEASGLTPGGAQGPTRAPEKELHVLTSASDFELRWQQGSTVLETQRVPRSPQRLGADTRFPALAQALTREWQSQGVHRDPSDRELDHAVLHVPNDLPFEDMVALLDALHAPRRGKASAFEVALASN